MKRSRLTWQSTGAQILTAEVGGWPLLYCSPLHRPDSRRPARGGVPVLFPQFADRGPLRKHGWARDVEWTLVTEDITDTTHRVQWEVLLDPEAHPDWPHDAKLELSTHVSADALAMELHITNSGASAFSWTGGLHPYWAIADVQECSITGLKGALVQDRTNPARLVEASDRVLITSETFESLYDTPAQLLLTSGHRTLLLTMTGFDQWMVWNPGATDARQMADLPEDDWRAFVCIEPVRVTRPCLLRPGETFVGTLCARWTDI